MPDDRVYWYVLFVKTGSEERIVQRLKDQLGSEGCLPFIPQKTCVFRRQGKKSLFQKICFPGYVFIESDKPSEKFMRYTFPVVYKLKEAYRFLSYEDRVDMAMREEERSVLSKLLGDERKIDTSAGFIEGDSVKIVSGSLAGKESIIQRINKGSKEAIIGIPIFGAIVKVSVGIEIVEKINR